MEIDVILEGTGGVLNSERIAVADNAENETVSLTIQRQIARWTLDVGDTIRIKEVE